MSFRNFGNESSLSSFQKEEVIHKILSNRNVYTKMVEDKAIKVARDGKKD